MNPSKRRRAKRLRALGGMIILMATLTTAAAGQATAEPLALTAAEASADPAAATARLQAAGVPGGEVVLVPSAQELVGTFVAYGETAGATCGGTEVVALDTIVPDARPRPTTLTMDPAVLARSTGRFWFLVGRAAQPGEQLVGGSPETIHPPGYRPSQVGDPAPCGAASERAAGHRRNKARSRSARARAKRSARR